MLDKKIEKEVAGTTKKDLEKQRTKLLQKREDIKEQLKKLHDAVSNFKVDAPQS
ncbi:hypothetical protein [Candidatus Phytoplasma fraxini]|uniref:hypothetical protein n=1 Tax=Ash yellows phytoplasma TaxID=35780 RepID=UPI0030FF3F8D